MSIPRLASSVLLCSICIILSGCGGDSQQSLRIESGLVSGTAGSDPALRFFKGIPYAAPPIFNLRWRPPEPPLKWDGVFVADRFGAVCMQQGRGWGEFYQEEFYPHPEPMSEDCLFLNVWTGARSPGEARPVLVWFHGGGLAEGSGSLPSFDGEALARKGLVVVTVNYRLNVFGFLAHPELTKESGRRASGNYGLLDQLAALQWVQRNISVFGGDPGKVTIAGQSGGSRAVHFMEIAPTAKGLFRYAIAQSGSSILRVANTSRLDEAERIGVKYAESLNAPTLKELRALPATALLKGEYRAHQPNIDGWFLPEDAYPVFVRGSQNDVPMLTGINSEEQIGFQPQTVKAEEFRDQVKKGFGALAGDFLRLYPAATDAEAKAARDSSTRDQTIVAMRGWAQMRATTAKTKLFVYYFSRKPPGRGSEQVGAFHSAEIEYVFGNLNATDRPWADADQKLSETMSSYWVNYVRTGDPNGPGLPKWPTYSESPDQFMELGVTVGPGNIMPDRAKFEFFERYFAGQLAPAP